MRSCTSKPRPVPGTQRGRSKWCFSSEPGLRALARGRPETRALFLKAAAVPALFLGVLQLLSFMVLGQLRLRAKRGFLPSLSASWCKTCSKFCNVSEPQLPRNNMTYLLGLLKDLMISSAPYSAPSLHPRPPPDCSPKSGQINPIKLKLELVFLSTHLSV